VEKFKARISRRQLRRWMAFYLIEPWGQPWLQAGRMTSLIRSAFTGRFDRHDEERFLITYRAGDEYRPKIARTDAEIAEQLASLPGLKKRSSACRSSGRSRPSSRPTRRASSRA
jgi:hypothetical protein